MEKAYQNFIKSPSPYDNIENTDSELEKEIVSWKIQGNNMGFVIGFEQGEGYYQWSLWTKTEEDYKRARYFMESLKSI